MKRNKVVAVAGAAIGIALFLAVGLLPAVLYGGYAGLMLGTGIFGSPLPEHVFARGLVAFGSLLGVFATAALFAVGGAAAATGMARVAAVASQGARAKAAQPQGNSP